jgi:hypothetical protein
VDRRLLLSDPQTIRGGADRNADFEIPRQQSTDKDPNSGNPGEFTTEPNPISTESVNKHWKSSKFTTEPDPISTKSVNKHWKSR